MNIPLIPGASFSRKKPVNLDPADEWLFSNFYRRDFPAISMHLYRRAFINHDFLLWQGLRIVRHSLYRREKLFGSQWEKIKFIIKNRLDKKAVRIPSGLYLTDIWSHNYFHWFIDVMQRYMILKEQGLADSPLLIPEQYSKTGFIMQSLQMLGIPCHPVREGEMYRIGRCRCVDYFFPPGAVHDIYLNNFREEIRRRIPALHPAGDNRLYVSRKNSDRRNITNEAAVQSLLSAFGFKTIYPEEMSWAEQVKTFSAASLVVGLHGAGLTNILFMQSGTLVELRMKGSVNQWCYYELASAMGLDYYYLLNDPEHPDAGPHEGNIVVNTNLLKDLLETILQKNKLPR